MSHTTEQIAFGTYWILIASVISHDVMYRLGMLDVSGEPGLYWYTMVGLAYAAVGIPLLLFIARDDDRWLRWITDFGILWRRDSREST